MRRWLATSISAASLFAAGLAHAQATDAGAAAAPSAPDGGGADNVAGCVESIPKGAKPPRLEESFPRRGTSGWVATLSVVVHHGKGERVLPNGLELSAATEAKKMLKNAGFALPEQGGPAGARLTVEDEKKDQAFARTRFELPLVPLPPRPGRNVMHLPALPIAIARANGEIATVCTHAQTIVVEDPTSSTPEATPRANPPPRPQLEEWTSLKRALARIASGVLLGAVIAYLAYRYAKRPRPEPPPPPPRPPWEIALEALDEVRHAGLLDQERYDEYFDRVSDVVRRYLGERFGFDGLESTTDEILHALEAYGSPGIPMEDVRAFLGECDLVKFANLTPAGEQCVVSLEAGEHLVRRTMPGAMTDALGRRALTRPIAPSRGAAGAGAPKDDASTPDAASKAKADASAPEVVSDAKDEGGPP